MLSKEKFNSIMEQNRQESLSANTVEKTCTNGTSENVLKFLKTLSDPSVMKETVAKLEKEMFQTYKEVHSVAGA